MRATSNDYKRAIHDDNRNFSAEISMTLSDKTVLSLDSSQLMSGGISFTASSSDENAFTIGDTVCEECTVEINNINNDYGKYNFLKAVFFVSLILKIDENTTETIKKGPFTVSKSESDDQTITLSAYDNMIKFEKKYLLSSRGYPATLKQITEEACRICGVSDQNYNMPSIYSDDDYQVPGANEPPELETTYRDIIGWVAQILGGYAKINSGGYLQFFWYNSSVFSNDLDGGNFTDYKSGDSADGGNFKSYTSDTDYDGGGFNSGTGSMGLCHNIYALTSQNIANNDITIGNIKVRAYVRDSVEGYFANDMFYSDSEHKSKVSGIINVLFVDKDSKKTYRWNSQTDKFILYTYDAYTTNAGDSYCITIEENPLIYLEQSRRVMLWIAEKLIALRFRPMELEALSDPAIEAGDPAYVTDRKGDTYQTYFTMVKYGINKYETLSCTNLEDES